MSNIEPGVDLILVSLTSKVLLVDVRTFRERSGNQLLKDQKILRTPTSAGKKGRQGRLVKAN